MAGLRRIRTGGVSSSVGALLAVGATLALFAIPIGHVGGGSAASAYYYYSPPPEATLTVEKVCQPATDGGQFDLLVGSDTVGTDVACGGSAQTQVAAGTYRVSETNGTGTNLGDYEASFGGACDAQGSVMLASSDSKTCTITNARKPVLTVTKNCPNGKQSAGDRFDVVINGTDTGQALDCSGTVRFTLAVGASATVTEAVPAGNMTTSLKNYKITYSSGCSSTALAAGASVTCTITNTLNAGGSAFTPGYWKNHPPRTAQLLPVTLGAFTVGTSSVATTIFNAMNCGRSKGQAAVACLAGQLLAAKLDVKNGSSNCINLAIDQADLLLVLVNYAGPGGSYTLTPSQRTQLLGLKDKLDRYNSGHGC